MSDGDSCRLKYFEGEPEVLAEVRQMWDEIFDDPEEFADYYFTEICKQNKILLAYKGDVLAGIIASYLAQGLSEWEAALLGVYIHGRAGEIIEKEQGAYSLLARNLHKRQEQP